MLFRENKIKLKELNQANRLILIIITWNILSPFVIGCFSIPRGVLYLTDLINLLLFSIVIRTKKGKINRNKALFWVFLFVIISFGSSVVHGNSPVCTLWGIRQNFRYFIFFYSCMCVIDEKCVLKILEIIEKAFWISFPLCIYQALFVSYSRDTIVGDMVGGIYTSVGGNAPLNIILCIYTGYIMLKCFNGKERMSRLLLVLSAAITMAVMAELKFFFVEVIFITVYCALASKMNWKAIVLIVLGSFMLSFVVSAFVAVNARGREYYTKDLFTLERMLEYVTKDSGYDGIGDLNRFTAIGTLYNMFFSRSIIDACIGFGIGAADYSKSIEFLTSNIYRQYNFLHYQYFSHAFIFIETGIFGIITYIMIFISSLIKSIMKWKNSWRAFYILCVGLMILLTFYNTSMRNELCAYILYAFLAIQYSKRFNASTVNERKV